jgi:hypothetical protein
VRHLADRTTCKGSQSRGGGPPDLVSLSPLLRALHLSRCVNDSRNVSLSQRYIQEECLEQSHPTFFDLIGAFFTPEVPSPAMLRRIRQALDVPNE